MLVGFVWTGGHAVTALEILGMAHPVTAETQALGEAALPCSSLAWHSVQMLSFLGHDIVP